MDAGELKAYFYGGGKSRNRPEFYSGTFEDMFTRWVSGKIQG